MSTQNTPPENQPPPPPQGDAVGLVSSDLFGMAATAAAAIHHELGDGLNAKRIHAALVNHLRNGWTQTPPNEQGTYWHWNGDEDCAPLPIFVLWSGFSGKCFVSCGQLGFKDAIDCDKYGGWWLPLYAPPLPNNDSQTPSPISKLPTR